MYFRSVALPRIAIALLLGLVPAAASAQTRGPIEPGSGELISFGALKVAADASVRFAGLQAKGRVRGIKIMAQESPCTVQGVTITYRSGQVHKETINTALKVGMPTALIDPRFDERLIETIDVTVKPGTCTGAMLEILAAQTSGELAELRRPRTRAATPASQEQPYMPVEVYYGTNRQAGEARVRGNNVKIGTYGAEPSGRLELGKATVSVPKNRKPGTIPVPRIDLLITTLQYRREDLASDFTVLGIDAMPQQAFVAAMRTRLGQADRFKGHAFVFIHGYFVTFDDAIFRAAQITYDMQFDGLPLVYSWPSAGRSEGYMADQDRAIGARTNLQEFLSLVARESGAAQVHVIAHSMGAVALIEALERMQLSQPAGSRTRFGELVFAAPDVLIEKFVGAVPIMAGFGRGITVYAAENDRALLSSDWLRRGLIPAGLVQKGIPVLAQGIESIDVTKLNTSYFAFNHSAFGDATPLLDDMAALLAKGLHPPVSRSPLFKPRTAPGGQFWRWEAQ